MSFSLTGPLTFLTIVREVSSKNSTRTWVTPPREPVLPKTLMTLAKVTGVLLSILTVLELMELVCFLNKRIKNIKLINMKTVYYIPMQLLTYRNMPTLLEVVQTEVKKKKVDEVGDGRPGEILKKLPKKKSCVDS